MLEIKLKQRTVAHPEANSVSEKINAAIKARVKTLMFESYSFVNAVKIHESIYNSSYHNTIKVSPNKGHFRRELTNINDTFNPTIFQQRFNIDSDYNILANNLRSYIKRYIIFSTLIRRCKAKNNI